MIGKKIYFTNVPSKLMGIDVKKKIREYEIYNVNKIEKFLFEVQIDQSGLVYSWWIYTDEFKNYFTNEKDILADQIKKL